MDTKVDFFISRNKKSIQKLKFSSRNFADRVYQTFFVSLIWPIFACLLVSTVKHIFVLSDLIRPKPPNWHVSRHFVTNFSRNFGGIWRNNTYNSFAKYESKFRIAKFRIHPCLKHSKLLEIGLWPHDVAHFWQSVNLYCQIIKSSLSRTLAPKPKAPTSKPVYSFHSISTMYVTSFMNAIFNHKFSIGLTVVAIF
jgi:hypothetical protein